MIFIQINAIIIEFFFFIFQVYSLDQGGSLAGLQMFKDVSSFKVICCGGDGTVGWLLETMGSFLVDYENRCSIMQ